MPYNEKTYKAANKYKESNIKRVPLDMQIDKYEELKAAAYAAGEKVNTYIKRAIEERMEREREDGQPVNSGTVEQMLSTGG